MTEHTPQRPWRLPSEKLRHPVKKGLLDFKTTKEIELVDDFLGQDRAKFSMKIGLSTHRSGYNMIVTGEPGTGRLGLVTRILESYALRKEAPFDWIYVSNFNDIKKPWAIQLPAGTAKNFQNDIEEFIESLLAITPALFENPSYQQQRTVIDKSFTSQYEKAIDEIEKLARKKQFALFQDSHSITFSPIKEGKILDESQFALLSDQEKLSFNKTLNELEDALNQKLLDLPRWKRESNEKLKKLHQESFLSSIEPLLSELEKKHAGHAGILIYLKELKKHLLKAFLTGCSEVEKSEQKEDVFIRSELIHDYLPKLLVENNSNLGAPVIYESHPTYSNLFGFIEMAGESSGYNTSIQHIEGGALHRANGGYLVLDLDKLLFQGPTWDALKRALKSMEIKIEIPSQEYGHSSSGALSPHSIPLDVKVILIAERETYYALQEQDYEFAELFRILVDFDNVIERDDKSIIQFAQLMKSHSENAGYAALTQESVAFLVEYSSRLCEDQRYFSARIGDIFELIGEAELIRANANEDIIERKHLENAIENKKYRNSRVPKLILDDMLDDKIHISTHGNAIGMINGLTIIQVGDSTFGNPSRITTTVYPGDTGILDIERESDLGESIHSKGIMILTGYLGSRYAGDFTLSISANITLEQSYGLIDGDSAALAELCSLLSAIAQVPIDQSIAVTGSINQYGVVQAVGGVNEKIEGFFYLCQARGLTGNQGVIIPEVNTSNLMLDPEVIRAVKDEKFHIYAVSHVDQALELLCDIPLGERDRTQKYPKNSFHSRVIARLKHISELANQSDASV